MNGRETPAPENSGDAAPAAPKSANTGNAQSLENVSIALQKTFSRVSASSSKPASQKPIPTL
jgi:hypothetical protein